MAKKACCWGRRVSDRVAGVDGLGGTYDSARFFRESAELAPRESLDECLEFCVLMVALRLGRCCRSLHCTCLILLRCQQPMRFCLSEENKGILT